MSVPRSLSRPAALGLVLALGWLLVGCGEEGNKLFRVCGSVTFDGRPVPAGKVYFIPDESQGNSGPQGRADIKDGRYDTETGGKGTNGGPMIVRIEGFDGPTLLFTGYETTVDLPRRTATQDFDVPADAAGDR